MFNSQKTSTLARKSQPSIAINRKITVFRIISKNNYFNITKFEQFDIFETNPYTFINN